MESRDGVERREGSSRSTVQPIASCSVYKIGFSCAQFKKNVSDIPLSRLPEHDDNFFLRWLRGQRANASLGIFCQIVSLARNFNLKKSEDMLRKVEN